MADASTVLEIILRLKDESKAGMEDAAKQLQAAGDLMKGVGTDLTKYVTLPLVAVAAAAIKVGTDFDTNMTLLQTQAGASAQEVAMLRTQILELAKSQQQTPIELSQGLYHLISLGLNAADAMKALKAASDGAAVGNANLEDVTNALGGAISTGIKGTQDYTQTMGALNAIVGAGNMRMTDLTGALGSGALATFKTAGLSLKDFGAALSTMTDNSIPAEDAATRLRMTISLIAAPTKQAKTELESIGLSQFKLADDMRNGGLLSALQDLHKHLSTLSQDQQVDVITRAFGGARSGGTIELLLGQLDRLGSKYTAIDTGVLKFNEDVNAQKGTSQAEFANALANVQVALIHLWDVLKPIVGTVLVEFTKLVQGLAGWFSNLSPGMQKFIIGLAALAAAAGPVLVVMGTIVGAIAFLSTAAGAAAAVLAGTIVLWTGGIILIVAAVAFAVYEIVKHWGDIKAATIAVWTEVTNWLEKQWNALGAIMSKVWGGIKDFFKTVWDGLVGIAKLGIEFILGVIITDLNFIDPQWRQHWKAISDFFSKMWADLKIITAVVMDWLKGIFNTTLDAINKTWTSVWGGVSKYFSSIWDDVKSSIDSAIKYITDAINRFVDFVNSKIGIITGPLQKIASTVGGSLSSAGHFIGGGLSQIMSTGKAATPFAAGGIVNGPTFALIGEAGPEAVIPLNMLGRGGAGGVLGQGGGAITININGPVYTQQDQVKQMADGLAKLIQQQMKLRSY